MENMCIVSLLLGTIIVSVSASTDDERYITYQDYGNVTRVIDLQAEIDPIILRRASWLDNEYLLYTRINPDTPQQLYTNNATSVTSSNYNPRVPTIVIVHGWEGNRNAGINPAITQAYLGKRDVNVIVLDWSWLSLKNYPTAVFGVPSAGRSLANFLTFLNIQTGAISSDLHLIGFSLGAHLVGIAGRSLNMKAARITGLDPAGPLWNLNPDRLRNTDAVYVEAIHTNRRFFGTIRNVGNTDFSPNGGYTQPGCLIDVCSHNRSWQYFAATVTFNNLIGHSCGSDVWLDLNMCFGPTLPMGNDDLRKTGNGIYRVKTTSNYPYA